MELDDEIVKICERLGVNEGDNYYVSNECRGRKLKKILI